MLLLEINFILSYLILSYLIHTYTLLYKQLCDAASNATSPTYFLTATTCTEYSDFSGCSPCDVVGRKYRVKTCTTPGGYGESYDVVQIRLCFTPCPTPPPTTTNAPERECSNYLFWHKKHTKNGTMWQQNAPVVVCAKNGIARECTVVLFVCTILILRMTFRLGIVFR